jgi:LacY proton/sugar symporter
MPCESPALKKQAAMTGSGASVGRERAGGDAEPGRRPVTRAARGHARRAALPRAAAFWVVAGVLFLLLFAAGAPAPLYGVYQAQWRFSATTLTAVFGVYALGVLVTLLVFGAVSDYLGRRRAGRLTSANRTVRLAGHREQRGVTDPPQAR